MEAMLRCASHIWLTSIKWAAISSSTCWTIVTESSMLRAEVQQATETTERAAQEGRQSERVPGLVLGAMKRLTQPCRRGHRHHQTHRVV